MAGWISAQRIQQLRDRTLYRKSGDRRLLGGLAAAPYARPGEDLRYRNHGEIQRPWQKGVHVFTRPV